MIDEYLAQATSPPTELWEPEILHCSETSDRQRFTRLLEGVAQVHDTIRKQLYDLVNARHPGQSLTEKELSEETAREVGDGPLWAYGAWVYYPWNGNLVHVLPEAEYREIRTDRNRYLILPENQRELSSRRIGIVGLSAGRAVATTLALEGVGGHFRVADFDSLELSNMNRLRAGCQDVGVNKAVLTARELFELDPYLTVEIFPQGIIDETLEAFLQGTGKLDVLVEECDDLYMKVLLREQAARLRIPVVMEMSFRGTVDVERFDLEPERPPSHGLLQGITARELRGLSTKDKVPFVMSLLGTADVPAAFAASLMEIDQTTNTWPQLASWVSCGGALAAGAARRVLLNEHTESGRFDLYGSRVALGDPEPLSIDTTPEATEARQRPATPVKSRSDAPTAEEITFLVEHAILAPSGGNAQPWLFKYERDELRCMLDVQRSESFLNYDHLGSYVAIGAAVENIALAATSIDLACEVEPFPNADGPQHICSMRFRRQTQKPSTLLPQIPVRVTNRRITHRRPLDPAAATKMQDCTRVANLHLTSVEAELSELRALLGRADRIRLLNQAMHEDFLSEIRWTPEEVSRTRDGVDFATLELGPSDRTALRMLSREAVAFLRRIDGGASFEDMSKDAVDSASALALLSVAGEEPRNYFEAGRDLQRFWLTATQLGYAVQPLSAILYMLARAQGGSGFNAAEERALASLGQELDAVMPIPQGHARVMLLRVFEGEEPSARSLRRPTSDVLTFI